MEYLRIPQQKSWNRFFNVLYQFKLGYIFFIIYEFPVKSQQAPCEMPFLIIQSVVGEVKWIFEDDMNNFINDEMVGDEQL